MREVFVGSRGASFAFLCSPEHYWRISHISLQRGVHASRIRCKWTKSKAHSCSKHCSPLSHHGFHLGILRLSTSAPKGLTKVSPRMSRIKNTLNSVSKAVFGKQNEMISRLAQLKPSSRILRKVTDSGWLKQKSVKQTIKFLKKYSDKSVGKSSVPAKESQVIEKDDIGKSSLFHYTNNITTKFGESFYFFHINSYFKREEKMSQQKEDQHFQEKSELELKKVEDEKPSSPDPGVLSVKKLDSEASLYSEDKPGSPSGTPEVLPISTKQSIANFLSRPTEGVQALVGGYIGGLVPKLKYDSKNQLEEQEEATKAEQAVSKDKNAEEKRRVSIDNRTRALVQALRRTTDPRLCINRVEELTFHLLEFPEGKGVAVKEKNIPYLLRLRQIKDETLQAAVREILALIGYVDTVKGRGIRILAIEGGGTRGVVALQTLRKLVELTQKPAHQLFDYICGVSTGAILAFMLGLFHMPLDECEELYRKLGSDVFSQNVIVGTVKMSWSHAFYDSQTWENILKDRMGSSLMIETARNPTCPKVAAVTFVFRNYGHFPGINSHYLGGCQYKMWQAIRASSAAPGYFAEYALGNDHQDGGLLLNNPSALAMHECKCLWPDVPLECIVSLGTGRYESDVRNNVTYTSLKTKLSNVINSATDTEDVHVMLDGLLPPDTYFRFNPVMCENIPLDESRNEKLNQLQLEGLKYIERNEEKMKKLAKILSQAKTTLQKINDWIKLKTDMYEGLPFFSKL
uniref:PNPLA domain-containing protein n=1 Tax=Moschus moschiferus TaxID=68415 RepID=A0A8C6G470_MOSMO